MATINSISKQINAVRSEIREIEASAEYTEVVRSIRRRRGGPTKQTRHFHKPYTDEQKRRRDQLYERLKVLSKALEIKEAQKFENDVKAVLDGKT